MSLGRRGRGLPCLQAAKEGPSFWWVPCLMAATFVLGVLAQALSTPVSRGVPLCACTCCSRGGAADDMHCWLLVPGGPAGWDQCPRLPFPWKDAAQKR